MNLKERKPLKKSSAAKFLWREKEITIRPPTPEEIEKARHLFPPKKQ